MITFHRGDIDRSSGDFETYFLSGELKPDAAKCLDKMIEECHKRGLKPFLYDWSGIRYQDLKKYLNSGYSQISQMQKYCKFYSNLALRYKDDTRLGGIGPVFANLGQGDDWSWYTSREACEWWAPLLQVFFDSVWDIDPNRLVVGSAMTDMGSTLNLVNDYWTPNTKGLNLRGPVIWRFMPGTSMNEANQNLNRLYPLRQSDYDYMAWCERWDQEIIIEQLTGFHSDPNWVWDAVRTQWVYDWVKARDELGLHWYWETYGWKDQIIDDTDSNWIRSYHTSYGYERPFVKPLRNVLKELKN